jgi:hypothetical protein
VVQCSKAKRLDVKVQKFIINMEKIVKKLPVLAFMFLISSMGFSQTLDSNQTKSKFPKCKGKYSAKWSNCNGEISFGEGDDRETYQGEFQNGLPHGEGIKKRDLFTYVGTFKYGLENGIGVRSFKLNGYESKLEGTWVSGSLEGQGVEKNSDGSSYEGNFKNSYKSGEGIQISKDKDKYVGEFQFDQRHGSGTLILSTGWRFVGKFKFGEKYGVGSFFDEKGKKRSMGQYRGGKKNGFGFMITKNGNRFDEGFYESDVLVKKEFVDEALLEENFIDIDIEKFIVENPNNLPLCPLKNDGFPDYEKKCWEKKNRFGVLHMGEFDKAERNGFSLIRIGPLGGSTIIGQYKDGKLDGRAMEIEPDGKIVKEGIYQLGELVKFGKVDVPIFLKNEYLAEIEKTKKLVKKDAQKNFNLKVTHTNPSDDGVFEISITTNADTASLLINGNEQGGRKDGSYSIKRVARAGQVSSFEIVATDIYGNKEAEIVRVFRQVVESAAAHVPLRPADVKKQPQRDAVAIIIGIADYKNLPRADYANDDARVFYDYAVRALGVKPENIKLLVDADADEVGIYRAFKTWLPSRVRASTDVYVYYSGHGLPTADGQGLYVLPQRADRDFIDKTAITQAEINAAIQSTKPKSVTIFLDACYSGQARSGETLVASARPVLLRTENQLFPDGFTVMTASQNDQISSSSPDLQHGIFSYYLMRGMEGDADANRDGRITAGEMQAYLAENVARQAGMMNRRQEPQLIGDTSRVLVGR